MDLIVLPVDHLLGDWWGLRTRLEDQGITPSLTFESNLAGNPVGGIRHGFTEADNLGLIRADPGGFPENPIVRHISH